MSTGILAHGAGHLFTLFPFLIFGLGLVFLVIAMRDGRKKKGPSTPRLPASHLSRQVHAALRPKRPRPTAPSTAPGDGGRGGRRLRTTPSGLTLLRPPPGAPDPDAARKPGAF